MNQYSLNVVGSTPSTITWGQGNEKILWPRYRAISVVRTLENWYRRMFLETGPIADAQRARALPRIAEDPTRVPDLFGMGSDAPIGASDKARFFGD